MNPETPAPAPVAPIVNPIETKAVPLNSNIPLNQQTNKILKIMEAMPEKKDTPIEKPADAPVEKPDDKPIEKPADKPVEAPNYFDDEEDEKPEITPFEVKTWQEYVSKGVQPISIIGKVGEEIKEFKVFTEYQLPADFQFNSDVDRLKYGRAFDRLERQAESLQQEFYQKQQMESVRKFEIQESKDISSDLTWLQNRGVVPKFEFEDTDPRFNSDPAVKEANAIYDLYKKVNNEYATKYMGTERSYRISYRDAADKYYAQKGRTPVEKPADKPTEKTPIQKQRDNIGGRIGAPQGGDAQTIKPKAFKGMSFTDINRLVRANKI